MPATLNLNDELSRVLYSNTALLRAARSAVLLGRKYVYGNPDAPRSIQDAQSRVDAFGTDAVRVFRGSGLTVKQIYVGDGEIVKVMPDGWGYVENPDGTVTLNTTGTFSAITDAQFAALYIR